MYASRHMVSVEENILYINSYILTNISYADFPKLVNKSQKRCMRSVWKGYCDTKKHAYTPDDHNYHSPLQVLQVFTYSYSGCIVSTSSLHKF